MEEEDDFPHPENFDVIEAVAAGKVGKYGKKLTLHISDKSHLEATLVKSDVATVSIPQVELEASGAGRYSTLEDLMLEMKDKLEGSLSYFPQGSEMRPKMENFLTLLQNMLLGELPFEIVLDDPSALSYVQKGSTGQGLKVEEEFYERTWEQDKELGLLEEVVENSGTEEESIAKVCELMAKSNKIIAFTGAGISVESGIPSFRGSENSIWSKYDESVGEYSRYIHDPESRQQYWKMKTEFFHYVKDAKPNPAHSIFGYLEDKGKLLAVITQNIDGLHVAGGVPREKVVQLHGDEFEIKCKECGKTRPREELHTAMENGLPIPQCDCGGIFMPGTIMFGQALKEEVLQRASSLLNECDLLVIIGSSLVVQPANKLPQIALSNKVPVIIVNKDSDTEYDPFAAVLVDTKAGEFMKKVQESLTSML